MVARTPFHERLSELNDQHLYTHWQGHLSALRYSHAPKHEYVAVRHSVGVFDTSPLNKIRVTGPDAERFLSGVLVRDVSGLREGRAAYTLWCDDRGFVMEDGVLFRHGLDELTLTSARPALAWLTAHRGTLEVDLEDMTEDYGILAVQGPRSAQVLGSLTPAVADLPWFGVVTTTIAGAEVTLSRTGFTGDLGYELNVPRRHCLDVLDVLDAVLAAGRDHQLRPFGMGARPGWRCRTARSSRHRSLCQRSTPGAPSPSSSTRASCPTTSSRPCAGRSTAGSPPK